jgi:molecular chaperone GrpE (heat shock protein)
VDAVSEPPPVARELITMADRLVDLRTSGTTEILEWLRARSNALLALCEVAPITDGGTVDFLRHEVVADRPAPRAELVDHIADSVRPGYLWRHHLIRPQQVIAYVDVGGS